MRHPDFWKLPGGRAYVRNILEAARAGSVVVQEPLGPSRLATALEDAIRFDGLDDCLRIDPEPSEEALVSLLRRRIGNHATTLEGFALHLSYVVLVSVCGVKDDAFASDLDVLASVAAGRPDDAGPRVIIVSPEGHSLLAAPTWRVSSTRGVLDHLDSASFAAVGRRRDGGMLRRLAVAVAMEVGAWDLEMVERILSLPDRAAVRPDLHLDRWTDERSDLWRGRSASWEEGSYDMFGGEPYVHPILLAVNALPLLQRRIWRGHVSALFPWIEEVRQSLTHRYRHLLTIEAASYSGDIESLDWGPLCTQLTARALEVRDFAHDCRKLRNCLAHGAPAAWEDIDRCLAAYSAWRRGQD